MSAVSPEGRLRDDKLWDFRDRCGAGPAEDRFGNPIKRGAKTGTSLVKLQAVSLLALVEEVARCRGLDLYDPDGDPRGGPDRYMKGPDGAHAAAVHGAQQAYAAQVQGASP